MVKSSSQRRTGTILFALLMAAFFGLASAASQSDGSPPQPDALLLQLSVSGPEMPAVRFLHDRHTDALAPKNDCKTCHLNTTPAYVFKFKRLENGTVAGDMALYHDNCIGCHEEKAGGGAPHGPLTGECRACHLEKGPGELSRALIALDKSLHYRHVAAKVIAPPTAADDTNCGACHHRYDPAAKQIFYQKGSEESCRYCHQAQVFDTARPLREASHSACVNCHRLTTERSQKAGPVECRGCHAADAQAAFEVVADVPRIERNQPDAVLLAAPLPPTAPDTAAAPARMQAVAFDHRAHETQAADCRGCHHAALDKCSTCHTPRGIEKGGFVSLEQAMHDRATTRSCTGCHDRAQRADTCAGCHPVRGNVPATAVTATCTPCHAIEQAAPPLPPTPEARAALARQAVSERLAKVALPLADDRIPETVTIDGMVDLYGPAAFPHRRIVKRLTAQADASRIASHFHDGGLALCQGCHHNTPASERPPGCAACHGAAFSAATDDRPGLKGAYHGQCITCHQVMKIQKPAATDCTGCHAKRT